MDADERDLRKRRRRSIRNLRRTSGILPLNLNAVEEEADNDTAKVSQSEENQQGMFGSMWCESQEPVVSKRRRRSSQWFGLGYKPLQLQEEIDENNLRDNYTVNLTHVHKNLTLQNDVESIVERNSDKEDVDVPYGDVEATRTNNLSFEKRPDPVEKQKMDVFEQLEGDNMINVNEREESRKVHIPDADSNDIMHVKHVKGTKEEENNIERWSLDESDLSNITPNDCNLSNISPSSMSPEYPRLEQYQEHHEGSYIGVNSDEQVMVNSTGVNSDDKVMVNNTGVNSDVQIMVNNTRVNSDDQVMVNNNGVNSDDKLMVNSTEITLCTENEVNSSHTYCPSESVQKSPGENFSDLSHSDKENSIVNDNTSLNITPYVKDDSADKVSPGFMSLCKAFAGKVANFVKTSPSFLTGGVFNSNNSANVCASPALKGNTSLNLGTIELSKLEAQSDMNKSLEKFGTEITKESSYFKSADSNEDFKEIEDHHVETEITTDNSDRMVEKSSTNKSINQVMFGSAKKQRDRKTFFDTFNAVTDALKNDRRKSACKEYTQEMVVDKTDPFDSRKVAKENAEASNKETSEERAELIINIDTDHDQHVKLVESLSSDRVINGDITNDKLNSDIPNKIDSSCLCTDGNRGINSDSNLGKKKRGRPKKKICEQVVKEAEKLNSVPDKNQLHNISELTNEILHVSVNENDSQTTPGETDISINDLVLPGVELITPGQKRRRRKSAEVTTLRWQMINENEASPSITDTVKPKQGNREKRKSADAATLKTQMDLNEESTCSAGSSSPDDQAKTAALEKLGTEISKENSCFKSADCNEDIKKIEGNGLETENTTENSDRMVEKSSTDKSINQVMFRSAGKQTDRKTVFDTFNAVTDALKNDKRKSACKDYTQGTMVDKTYPFDSRKVAEENAEASNKETSDGRAELIISIDADQRVKLVESLSSDRVIDGDITNDKLNSDVPNKIDSSCICTDGNRGINSDSNLGKKKRGRPKKKICEQVVKEAEKLNSVPDKNQLHNISELTNEMLHVSVNENDSQTTPGETDISVNDLVLPGVELITPGQKRRKSAEVTTLRLQMINENETSPSITDTVKPKQGNREKRKYADAATLKTQMDLNEESTCSAGSSSPDDKAKTAALEKLGTEISNENSCFKIEGNGLETENTTENSDRMVEKSSTDKSINQVMFRSAEKQRDRKTVFDTFNAVTDALKNDRRKSACKDYTQETMVDKTYPFDSRKVAEENAEASNKETSDGRAELIISIDADQRVKLVESLSSDRVIDGDITNEKLNSDVPNKIDSSCIYTDGNSGINSDSNLGKKKRGRGRKSANFDDILKRGRAKKKICELVIEEVEKLNSVPDQNQFNDISELTYEIPNVQVNANDNKTIPGETDISVNKLVLPGDELITPGQKRRRRKSAEAATLRLQMINEKDSQTTPGETDISVNNLVLPRDELITPGQKRRRRKSAEAATLRLQMINENETSPSITDTVKTEQGKRGKRKSADAATLKIQMNLNEESTCSPGSSSPDDQAKTAAVKRGRKRKYSEVTQDELEKIYRNKNFVRPVEKPFQSVLESPINSSEIFGKKRLPRHIEFEKPSQMKLRRRLQKAVKNGWDPKKRRRHELDDNFVQEKLINLWSELDEDEEKSESLESKLRSIVETTGDYL